MRYEVLKHYVKPCPFCGSEEFDIFDDAVWDDYDEEIIQEANTWYFVCTKCNASGGVGYSKAEAFEAWNRRAALDESDLSAKWLPMSSEWLESVL